MKKWDSNHVKLPDFIISRWLQVSWASICPVYIRQIYPDKLQNLVNICPYQLDLFRRNKEIGIKTDKN